MSALNQVLEAIRSARSLGAQSIRFTVSSSMAAELQLELAAESSHAVKPKPDKPKKKPSRRKLRNAQRDAEGSAMTIDGCPVFIGDGDGMSYSWRR
jgi:hypothetical protein